MNKIQVLYLLILGIIIWFIVFDFIKLMLIIFVIGAVTGIMLLLFALYDIYKELGDDGDS